MATTYYRLQRGLVMATCTYPHNKFAAATDRNAIKPRQQVTEGK